MEANNLDIKEEKTVATTVRRGRRGNREWVGVPKQVAKKAVGILKNNRVARCWHLAHLPLQQEAGVSGHARIHRHWEGRLGRAESERQSNQ